MLESLMACVCPDPAFIECSMSFGPEDFNDEAHYDLGPVCSIHKTYLGALSVLVMLTWVRLLKYLRAIKAVGIIIEVLQRPCDSFRTLSH